MLNMALAATFGIIAGPTTTPGLPEHEAPAIAQVAPFFSKQYNRDLAYIVSSVVSLAPGRISPVLGPWSVEISGLVVLTKPPQQPMRDMDEALVSAGMSSGSPIGVLPLLGVRAKIGIFNYAVIGITAGTSSSVSADLNSGSGSMGLSTRFYSGDVWLAMITRRYFRADLTADVSMVRGKVVVLSTGDGSATTTVNTRSFSTGLMLSGRPKWIVNPFVYGNATGIMGYGRTSFATCGDGNIVTIPDTLGNVNTIAYQAGIGLKGRIVGVAGGISSDGSVGVGVTLGFGMAFGKR
ncbi:MAG: hypothetical protein WCG85_09100 [Polyangia bacterium]